jgi:DNA-binding protein H-NS
MKFDQISSTEFLQKILEENGDVAFLEFSKNVESVKEEAQKRVKEREEAQKAIEDKIAELHDLIISDGIVCDQDQLKAFFLKQLDDKYTPRFDTSQQDKKPKEKQKLPAKYSYKDKQGKQKTWVGKGRIPGELVSQIQDQNGNPIDMKNASKEQREEYLKPFLID